LEALAHRVEMVQSLLEVEIGKGIGDQLVCPRSLNFQRDRLFPCKSTPS